MHKNISKNIKLLSAVKILNSLEFADADSSCLAAKKWQKEEK